MGNLRKLKPCPFCGAPDDGGIRVTSSEDMTKHAAFCPKCDAQGPMVNKMHEAVTMWNKSGARVDALEAMAHEIAASLSVDNWGPEVDVFELGRAVKVFAGRLTDAEQRLSAYECVDHPVALFGECDTCDEHNQEPEEKLL